MRQKLCKRFFSPFAITHRLRHLFERPAARDAPQAEPRQPLTFIAVIQVDLQTMGARFTNGFSAVNTAQIGSLPL